MWPLYPGSYVGTKDLNSGPCACETSTLLTEPSLALILFLQLHILHTIPHRLHIIAPGLMEEYS